MSYEAKLQEMGIRLPDVPKPVAAYVPAVLANGFVYTSGQVTLADGALQYKGKVGKDLTQEDGYAAARLCGLNCLAALRSMVGTLDKVQRIVKVTVFVNSAPGFTNQPEVGNGASELFMAVFGEAGRHARAAVGVSELPRDSAVEVEIIAQVSE